MSARPNHTRRRGLAVAAVVAALLVPLAACSDDDDETTTEGTTATSAPATSETTDTSATSGPSTSDASPSTKVDGIDPMDDAGTDPVSGEAEVDGVALLTAVDAARHEGYDRVVWTFENGTPGYDVAYDEGPFTQDGSGDPVTVQGAAFIRVRMEPASGVDLSGAEYRQTYTGPTTIDPDTPEITEIVSTGDFEAVSTWVVGVQDPGVAFRVQVLTDPPRLVLDVQNH
jgi:hypothetical protein